MIIKLARFDLEVVKPYLKNIIFALAVPVLFVLINRSIFSGIAFAMCFVSMTEAYPFSIFEKNQMERIYGFLPITRAQTVKGRYLYCFLLGLIALVFSILVQSMAMCLIGVNLLLQEILAAGFAGFVQHSMYTVFLLPGYYKYGPIKGKTFMYIPVAGFLIIILFIEKLNLFQSAKNSVGDPIQVCVGLLILVGAAYAISLRLSISIMENKEL